MWTLETEVYELFVRATFIYFFLFTIFRLIGRKHFSDFTSLDLILLLIISEAVSSSLNAEDKGIPAAIILVLTLVMWDVILNRMTYFSKRAEKVIDGTPHVLILRGVVNKKLMRKQLITDNDLAEAMRLEGIPKIDEIEVGVLETNGRISFITKEKGPAVPGPILN